MMGNYHVRFGSGEKSSLKITYRYNNYWQRKNRYAFDTEDITLKTGTVKGESKVASLSDPETFMLTALNADAALKEFLGTSC